MKKQGPQCRVSAENRAFACGDPSAWNVLPSQSSPTSIYHFLQVFAQLSLDPWGLACLPCLKAQQRSFSFLHFPRGAYHLTCYESYLLSYCLPLFPFPYSFLQAEIFICFAHTRSLAPKNWLPPPHTQQVFKVSVKYTRVLSSGRWAWTHSPPSLTPQPHTL